MPVALLISYCFCLQGFLQPDKKRPSDYRNITQLFLSELAELTALKPDYSALIIVH